MSCLELDLPDIEIPAILLPNLDFVLAVDFGELGVTCCKFRLPSFALPIPVTAIIAALGGPTAIAALNAAIMTANEALGAALAVLDGLELPNCPIDGLAL